MRQHQPQDGNPAGLNVHLNFNDRGPVRVGGLRRREIGRALEPGFGAVLHGETRHSGRNHCQLREAFPYLLCIVRCRARAPGDCGELDITVPQLEVFLAHVEQLGRDGLRLRRHFNGSQMNGGTSIHRSTRGEGSDTLRDLGGITGFHPDRVDRHAKLVGRNLR